MGRMTPHGTATPPAPTPAPVTTAVGRRVLDGREAEFVAWAESGMELVRRREGFLGAGWLRSGTAEDEWHVVHRFADERTLAAWIDSPERREWVGRGEGTARDDAWRRLSGVEGWFAPLGSDDAGPPPAPPRWKQAVTIWLGFFPVSLLLALLVVPQLDALDVVARTLLTTLLTTPLMVYGVLPLVTRAVRPWLQRG